MRKVKYLEWEHIMLDTSIVFAYLQAMREGNTDTNCVFVKRVIDDLNELKSVAGKKRSFYLSAISIAEMYDKSTDIKKTEKIITKMNVESMTYVSFDTDIAEHMTSNYHSLLGKEKLSKFAKELGWPEHEMTLAREWVNRDLMIIATGDYLKCDALLTIDEKTMLPSATAVDVYCCVCREEYFNQNPKHIFEYEKTN